MTERVKVIGLKELRASFRKLDAETKKGLGKEISAAAVPVRDAARNLEQRYQGASVRTVRVKRSGPVVAIQQSKEKVTGKRSDFGSLQMQRVLIPALKEHEAEVVEAVDRAITKWIREVE